MKKFVLFLACGLLIGNIVFAQGKTKEETTHGTGTNTGTKFGYLNSNDLLAAIPERVKADSALSKYQKSFQDQYEEMVKEYQTKGQAFQSGEKTMTDAVKEVKAKEIQDLQSRIEGFQQSAQEKLQTKKSELYGPILDKLNKAISAVGKDHGYNYIFDVTQGAVLYYDGDDVLPLVKAKLGIK